MSTTQKCFDILRSFYESRTVFNEEEWELIASMHRHKTLAKGEVFSREGEVCTQLAFLAMGQMRYYYKINNKEYTSQFFFPQSIVTDYISMTKNRPSRLTIEAMTESEVLIMDRGALQVLYEKIPNVMYRLAKNALEEVYFEFAERVTGLLLDTPEKRYIKLMEHQPRILQNVPQYMIASYLGITPEALSRIRSRIAKENR
jgi:CRP-like cAMP-binding protein